MLLSIDEACSHTALQLAPCLAQAPRRPSSSNVSKSLGFDASSSFVPLFEVESRDPVLAVYVRSKSATDNRSCLKDHSRTARVALDHTRYVLEVCDAHHCSNYHTMPTLFLACFLHGAYILP